MIHQAYGSRRCQQYGEGGTTSKMTATAAHFMCICVTATAAHARYKFVLKYYYSLQEETI